MRINRSLTIPVAFVFLLPAFVLLMSALSSVDSESMYLTSTHNVVVNEGDGMQSNYEPRIVDPTDIPGIVTFWDFQEPAGTSRMSRGRYKYALQEMNGPIKHVEDGIFGRYCADVEWGQWFRIKRQDAPGLNLHGKDQHVSMVAWVKRESDKAWQYIAGVWDEGTKDPVGKGAPGRQYAIFMSGKWQNDYTTYVRAPAEHQAMGYVSITGAETPGHPFAFDYATGRTQIQKDRWYMLAFTYDGKAIKVYVDGVLDKNGNYNPFMYDKGIYDGGENGADFTVALRRVPIFSTYPDGVPENDTLGFDGRIGGLAVYDRALSANEIKRLYTSTMTK